MESLYNVKLQLFTFPSPGFCLSQGYPGEKGATGSSDIIDFNGKLLDAFQVRDIRMSVRPDQWLQHVFQQECNHLRNDIVVII